MDLSTILTTICFILSARSADLVNPGSSQTHTVQGSSNIVCSGEESCTRSLFYITNAVPIWVNCTGTMSCEDSVFYFKGSADAYLLCEAKGACYNTLAYVFNPIDVYCKSHNDVGYDSCRDTAVLDLVPPQTGQISITVEGSHAYGMSVFSFYHQGQNYYCINSCYLGDISVWYGLKFNEYCNADDTSCLLTQAAISDTVYGTYSIMDSLSGNYGTDYDYSAYQMSTNVILPLVDYSDADSTFYPPVMTDSTAYLSILCHACSSETFEFGTVNNVILTGMKTYGVYQASVNGPISSFMVNSYHALSVYDSTFTFSNHQNVYIVINTLSISSVYLGDNVDVEINCEGPGYNCYQMQVSVYSDMDPDVADLSNFHIDCSSGCQQPSSVDLILSAPATTCYFTDSNPRSDCSWFSPTEAPTTAVPTTAPTSVSMAPTNSPTDAPSLSTFTPTEPPSNIPTNAPSSSPTQPPTASPSQPPTQSPSRTPSQPPTVAPSASPTQPPTAAPSFSPSVAPTMLPTETPSAAPSFSPSAAPTMLPTETPTQSPTRYPTAQNEYSLQKQIIFTFILTGNDKAVIDSDTEATYDAIIGIIERMYVHVSVEKARVVADVRGVDMNQNDTLQYRQFNIVRSEEEMTETYTTAGQQFQLTMITIVHYEALTTVDELAYLSSVDGLFVDHLKNETIELLYSKYSTTSGVAQDAVRNSAMSVDATVEEMPVIEPETDYVLWSLMSFLFTMFLGSMAARCWNGRATSKVDNADWSALIIFGLQIFDLVTDMNLSYEILGRFGEDPPQGSNPLFLILSGFGCTLFVLIPWFVNIGFAINMKSYVRDNDKAWPYFENKVALFIVLVVFSGSTYPVLVLLSSRIFGWEIFNCGLTFYELRTQLVKLKIYGSILFENIPQLFFQILYLIYAKDVSKTILLSFAASLLSILSTVFSYWMERKKSKKATGAAVQYSVKLQPEIDDEDENYEKLKVQEKKNFNSRKERKGELGAALVKALRVEEGEIEIGPWLDKRVCFVQYGCSDASKIKEKYLKRINDVTKAFDDHFIPRDASIAEEKGANSAVIDPKTRFRSEFIGNGSSRFYKLTFYGDWDETEAEKLYKEEKKDGREAKDVEKAKRKRKKTSAGLGSERRAYLLKQQFGICKNIISEIVEMRKRNKSKRDIKQYLLKEKYPKHQATVEKLLEGFYPKDSEERDGVISSNNITAGATAGNIGNIQEEEPVIPDAKNTTTLGADDGEIIYGN